MNGSYFNNNLIDESKQSYQNNDGNNDYMENILMANKGKKVKIYASFPGSNEWQDKIFNGIIENSGKDYLIVSDPKTGEWNLVLFIYINYILFEENVNYR